MGRRTVHWLTHVRQCTLSKLEDRCAEIFSDPVLKAPPRPDPRRERPYSTRRTFWCFLWQILNENTSCRDVVRQLQAVLALHGILNLDEANSAYCQARIRLPVRLLRQSWQDSAQTAEHQAPERRLLQGRVLKAADGSTVLLPDTPENQKVYPQQKGQKPGCGFPIMRLSVVFSLTSGAVVDVAQGNYYQHELRLFHSLHPHLQKGEIVVYDRAGGHFVLAASLRHRDVDLISRVLKRHIDGRRRHKRLGKRDWLMVWKKSPQKPAYLTEEEWAALPAEITVRVLKVKVSQKGCRTRELILMTTLLDPERYPAKEIAEAYGRRWRLELCLDDLKTTLGMEHLRCQSPTMVEKELLMFLIAHNVLRWVMAQAASEHEVALDRISFTGALDAFRQFATAMAQAKKGKKRQPLWETLLRTLARDLVPERPGRREPRAVKRRPKPYPLLNKPRHQFREEGRRAYYKPMSYN
jgi:putative transposase